MAKILKNIGIGTKKYGINANNGQAQRTGGGEDASRLPKASNKTKWKKLTSNSEYSTDEFIHLMTNLRNETDPINKTEIEPRMNVYEIRSATPRRAATSACRDTQGSLQWQKQSYLPTCKIDHVNKDISCANYTSPADLKPESATGRLNNVYSEPCKREFNEEITSDDTYEDVDANYDTPWEWTALGDLSSRPRPRPPARTMSGRQRQRPMYETAFDSMVKRDTHEEEMMNHPILRNECSTSTPKTAVRAVTTRRQVASAGDCLTPKEKRKVTLFRGEASATGGEKCSLVPAPAPAAAAAAAFKMRMRTEATVHAPPKSANSTPSLAHRLRRIDSIASSARSTPTHYMSSTKVKVPTKPLSDLTLGSASRASSLHVVPAAVCKLKSSYSSEGRFSLHSDGDTQPSTSDSLLSDGSTKTDSSEIILQTEKNEDRRPDDEYDVPWNYRPKTRTRTLPFSFSLDSAQLLEAANTPTPTPTPTSTPTTNTQPPPQPVEKKRPILSLALNKQDSFPPAAANANGPSKSKRPVLSMSFDSQSQSRKQSLQLNFGCAALSVVGEKVDASIPLQKQGWFHGSITRVEAENVLRLLKEGSYLVRNSESNKHDFSLSLKSARGFMHMKIVNSDEKYILGQFSKPFDDIPEMISHYSIYKLPIKGAEHMSLLHPVIDQLL